MPSDDTGAKGKLYGPILAGRAELAIAAELALALAGPIHKDTFKVMRGALGETAKAVAALLGVSAETVSRWETGARDVERFACWPLVTSCSNDRASQPAHARASSASRVKRPPRKSACRCNHRGRCGTRHA